MGIYGHIFQPDHQTLKPAVCDEVTGVQWLHFATGDSHLMFIKGVPKYQGVICQQLVAQGCQSSTQERM